MTPDLTQALESASVFGAAVRPLMVGAILLGLWHALARSGLGEGRRRRVWGTVAAILVGWLILVWTLASRGVLSPPPGTPQAYAAAMIVVPSAGLVGIMLTLLMRSGSIVAAVDAAPLWWLVAYQGYRVTGFIFVRLWWQGFLPGYFALPAGVGDTLTGIFAILAVVVLLRGSSWGRGIAYAVNIFGIADLVNAMSMGVLSALSSGNQASPMLLYPLIMVPSFGVPLAFIIHSLSIWQLRRRFRVPSPVMVPVGAQIARPA